MQNCQIERCTLLDPLAESYVGHRNCPYDNGKFLRGAPRPLFQTLGKTKIGRGLRRVVKRISPRLLFLGTPIHRIIPKPIEEMPAGEQFDLIVLINVIEHCYDVNLVFEKIKSIAKSGALLVFHDKYYYHERVAQEVGRLYDAGHPLRVDRKVVDDFLDEHFTPVFKKIGHKESKIQGVDLGHDTVYFVGKLR